MCYIDTDSFVFYIKPEDIHSDIAKNVEVGFDTLNYELDRSLPKENEKVIGLIKDELGEKDMKYFFRLRAKMFSYSMEDNGEYKKSKSYKKACHKKPLNFKDYKNCLKGT